MQYSKYESYKPSGIPFAGNIPAHWEVSKIKKVCTLFGRIGYRGYTTMDLVNVGEGAITISPSNMRKERTIFNECTYISWFKYNESPEIKIYNNDILFVKTGSTCGKIALVENLNDAATINPQLCVLKNISCYYKFLWFVLMSPQLQFQVKGAIMGGTIPTMAQAKINNFSFPLPPLSEQIAIAAYLDRKLSDIDTFIAKKQRLVTLLQEQKAAMINKAVTKGLNESVEMQNATLGGSVPAHWSMIKLKYSTKLNTHKQFDKVDSRYFKIGLEHIESKTGKILATHENAFEGEGVIFKTGDVLFGKLRPYLAKVTAPTFEGHCVNDILVITPNKTLWKTDFLKYRLLSKEFIDLVDNSTFGVKMPRASWDFIGSIKIPVPPLSEQIAIVSHIETESARIDKAISLVERELTLVQEYRTALIAEAVTGKIKCPDAM